jgi:hypothetical protein
VTVKSKEGTISMSNPDDPADQFRGRAQIAGVQGFAAGFPNFYFAPTGNQRLLLGGTIFVKPRGVSWRDVPLADLGSPHLTTGTSPVAGRGQSGRQSV